MKLIYAPGTTVTYNKKADRGSSSYVGRETIIYDVSLTDGEIAYGTLEGAWFTHESLDWVADPTQESLEKVFESLDDESIDEDEEFVDSDDEDGDDEDGDDDDNDKKL